jgi:uncharacterized protein YeaO (DUF488 family)
VIKTRRWCDPAEPDDGFRVLVARYRPRGVSRAEETWSGFMPQLGPSRALHAAYYGKSEPAISPAEYALRYAREMESQRFWIRGLAEHVRAGRALTLLCSSACTDEQACHRSLLRGMIERELRALESEPESSAVVRRKK